MSNFTTIESALLTTVNGGGFEGEGEVKTPGVSVSGKAKVTQDAVKQYENSYTGCKQQAADNFGNWYQFGGGPRLDRELAACEKQFGRQ